MNMVFLWLMILFSISANAMDEKRRVVLSIHEKSPTQLSSDLFKEVAPGVYAGETQIGGAIVYFGMEKVDESNIKQWDFYKDKTRYLTQDSRGIFAVWPSHMEDVRKSSFEQLKNITGFTDDFELKTFLDKVEKFGQENKTGVTALQKTGVGVAGFQIFADENHYVVYASNKPVIGRFPFPENMPTPFKLKQYYEYFGSILMILRSENHPPESNRYSNRGIFKSPISWIEDGKKYPGLSLKLHGFSAAVIQHIFKNKEYMTVAPASAMRAVLLNVKWKKGDFFIEDKDFTDLSSTELDRIKNGGEEPRCRIKIDALIRLYKGEM